jgi:hypothetical protein
MPLHKKEERGKDDSLPLSSFSSAQLERSEQPATARKTAAQAAAEHVAGHTQV